MSANQLQAMPESSQASLKHIRGGMRRHLLVGGIAFVAIVFGLGGMAATFDFAGAVATQGRLVVNSSVKKVQHVTGGTVTELKVKDGDHVKAGDLLIRLDPTLAAANLAIYSKGLDEIAVRKTRLEAERDGLEKLIFPADVLARSNEPAVAELIKIETEPVRIAPRGAPRPAGPAAQEDRRARPAGRRHRRAAGLGQAPGEVHQGRTRRPAFPEQAAGPGRPHERGRAAGRPV